MADSKIEWTEKHRERFWNYVNRKGSNQCWEWGAGLFVGGYGQFRVGKKKMKAHRFAYILTYGEIPKGKIICHTCDNRRCVNPKHLFLATHKINSVDRELKGRGAFNLKAQPGEFNGSSKLKNEQVLQIRQLYQYNLSYKQLAKLFNISSSQIANIVKGRSWKCLQKVI